MINIKIDEKMIIILIHAKNINIFYKTFLQAPLF
jgi:hypothetical protein